MGLNQTAFADEIGIDYMTVSRWERNLNRPTKLAAKVLSLLAEKEEKDQIAASK